MLTDELVEPDTELRERAIRRLKKKRDFHGHLLVYVLFNSAVAAVWVLTGADGIFWPAFLMAFWGIGVVMNAWDVYHDDGFSEDAVAKEMHRLR